MTTINRANLLASVMLVRPALASQSFIPAWTHILFDGGSATTYNDTMSITVSKVLNVDASICVPGELLIKALSSFNAEQVMVQSVNDNELLLTSGRSKLKVPVLPGDDFKLPVVKGTPATVEITDDVLEGIKRCLFSVGTDPTHPAQMGVTLDASADGHALLFSTDNLTISRYVTKSKISLPGGSPIILPTLFCEQVLVFGKTFKEDDLVLEVYPGALVLRVGRVASLLTKTLVDLEPQDFEAVVGKYFDVSGVKKQLSRLPDSFDAAFNRALLVLSNEADKSTKVTPNKDGVVELYSKSALGEAQDDFTVEQRLDCKPFHIDPAMVLRAAKTCGSVAFYPRVMVLGSDDGSFLHLIAHCIG